MMKFNKHWLLAVVFMITVISCDQNHERKKEKHTIIDEKVDSLMDLMTLEEKIGQLNMPGAGDITTGLEKNTGIAPKIKAGKVGFLLNIKGIDKIHKAQRMAVEESRLGIPIIFAMDVIHGHKTLFPVPLALAATWDMDMIEQTARTAAKEASAEGISLTFSPMVDICRDPRWGRIVEGPGEDPYLGSEFARAMVKGYQGSDLSQETTIMGCAKHFALYGAPEAGRDYNTVDMSRPRMFNVYLPPFKAAMEAGVGSMMAAFNDVDAVPATGNKWLLTKVLRKRWGFNGFVVSDFTGVKEIIAHGVGRDLQSVSAIALDAGLDVDMISEGFLTTLVKSVKEGKIDEKQIDEACRRILTAKYTLGLFKKPYQYGNEERAETEIFSAEHRAFARRVAADSYVLLKNEGNLLPMKKRGTIGVIGPLGNNRENMAGTWSVAGDFGQCASLMDGLKNAVGKQVDIIYARGSNIYRDAELEARVSIYGKPTYRDDRSESEMLTEALSVADKSDVIIAAVGEAAEMSGECSSRSNIAIPAVQMNLLKTIAKTGKPVVMVLFTGRPLTIKWADENIPVILNAWFGGTEAGNAIADILFGDVNPSGKLPVTFPQNPGQVPIYYSTKSTGRPLEGEWFQKFKSNYLDVSNKPLYPFGYGLSYSTFEYSDLKLSKHKAAGNDTVIASVYITNISERNGKDVVQLYIHDVLASTTRPNKELKGFEKVMITAGETRKVSFAITSEMLRFYKYDPESDYEKIVHEWEEGEFDIMIGPNSANVKKAKLTWYNK